MWSLGGGFAVGGMAQPTREVERPRTSRPLIRERGHVELLTKQPTTQSPGELFTGNVYFDVIARGEGESR